MVQMSAPRWSQHALVEENERVHGLVLRGCGHVALRGQMGQEREPGMLLPFVGT